MFRSLVLCVLGLCSGCGLLLDDGHWGEDSSAVRDASFDTGTRDAAPGDSGVDATRPPDAEPVDSGPLPVDSGVSDAGPGDATMCIETPCRLVAPQCGCDTGEGCYLSSGAGCLPAGVGPVDAACEYNDDCVPGTGCMGSGGLGACRPYCYSAADCESGERCIRLGAAGGAAGICEPLCDPLGDTGCPSGRQCIVANSRTEPDGDSAIATGCGAPGVIPPGSPCSTTSACVSGSACDGMYCRRLCDVALGPCVTGLPCSAVGFMRDGTTLGICI